MNKLIILSMLNITMLAACSQPEHLKSKANLAQWMHERVSRDICFDDSIKECVSETQKKHKQINCIDALKAYQATCKEKSFPSLQGPVTEKELNQYPAYQICVAAQYLQANNVASSKNNSCQIIYQNALKAAM